MILLLAQYDTQTLLKTLLSPDNPIYVGLILVLLILIILVLTFRYVINPANEKIEKERETLELKAAKLMAQFAELDPDPLIRIDRNGQIIETNNAALRIFYTKELKAKDIRKLIPSTQFNPVEVIENNLSITFTTRIHKRYFSLLLRGEKSLDFAQLYFRDITELKESEKKLFEYQKKLKTLSDRLQTLLEEERVRIARGLHDGIGQNLSLLRINLLKLKEPSNIPLNGNLDSLILNLEETIDELKNISYSLKPKMLEELGLAISLNHMIERIAANSGIKSEYFVVGEEIRIGPKLELTIYRLVQEALNNIIKHAKATNFSVQLILEASNIRLIISDNGIGFDFDEVLRKKSLTRGMGIFNMIERVESFGGSLKVDSSSKNGTMIVAEIPINEGKYERI